MFKFIKGLFNKKEIEKIKELEEKVTAQQMQIKELEMDYEKLLNDAWELRMTLEAIEEEGTEDDDEKCSCGGNMMPMYDEHPNWIKFCTTCNKASEDTNMSPIIEPA